MKNILNNNPIVKAQEYLADEWLKACVFIHWKWWVFTNNFYVPLFQV